MFCLNVGGPRITFEANLDSIARSGVRVHRRIETGKAAGHSVMNRRRRYTGSNPSLRRVLYRAHLGVALVAFPAGLAVTLVGLLTLRAYADPNQQLIARSISYTVEAAVVFGDAQAAEESLALIASSEEVSSAIVYDRQGQPLASWHRESTGPLHLLEQQLAHWLLSAPTEQPILRRPEDRFGGDEGSGGSLLRFTAHRFRRHGPVPAAYRPGRLLPVTAAGTRYRRPARPTGEGRAYRAPQNRFEKRVPRPASPS